MQSLADTHRLKLADLAPWPYAVRHFILVDFTCLWSGLYATFRAEFSWAAQALASSFRAPNAVDPAVFDPICHRKEPGSVQVFLT